MIRKLFLPLLIFSFTNCRENGQHSASPQSDSLKSVQAITSPDTKAGFEKTEITCDTVYKNKGYQITLTLFDNIHEDETTYNTLFTLNRLINGQYQPIYADSIVSSVREIDFVDFNNDHVKDILVQHSSDVRSNRTYCLYLVDTAQNKLKKIKGFEVIKNPEYLPEYNLVDNYVVSGKNWTSFYRIMNDTIKDYNIIIYDDQNDLAGHAYKAAFENAIRTIAKSK
jgi:hemoglobin-like flavoprotein